MELGGEGPQMTVLRGLDYSASTAKPSVSEREGNNRVCDPFIVQ